MRYNLPNAKLAAWMSGISMCSLGLLFLIQDDVKLRYLAETELLLIGVLTGSCGMLFSARVATSYESEPHKWFGFMLFLVGSFTIVALFLLKWNRLHP